jgi:glyoxylase-like metal-dependent hydrolase (beta-lactamase superfamily II)
MQRLAKDIYVETNFPGVTVGAVITPAGPVCIDTPTHPADARRWRLKLAQLSDRPVQYIINLDHHRDRVLGNAVFEAPVIAHDAAAERLQQLPETFKAGGGEAGADADLAAEVAGVRLVTPSLTFSGRMRLALDGPEIHLVARPGQSPAGIWVELPKEQIVFAGDSLALGAPPPLAEANLDVWLDHLAELRKKRYPANVIVPGRGGVTHKTGVKTMESFLRLVRRKLEALARAKKPRADAGALAESLVREFSVPASLREHYTRRLRSGLEALYDLRASGMG